MPERVGNAKSFVEVVGRAYGKESAGKVVEESRAPKEVDGCSWPAARSTSSTRTAVPSSSRPRQVAVIDPRHDGWVVGDEAAVLIESTSRVRPSGGRLGMPVAHRHG